MSGTAGVIGLGIMGGAMARHLVKAGFTVHGFDPSADAVEAARGDGVETLASAAAVAEKAGVIVCSLPNPLALRAVAEEIASSSATGCVMMETSTLKIADKEAARDILAAAGHTLLDCPLSGTGQQAQTGDLAVYSGAEDAVAKCLPVIEAFSRKTNIAANSAMAAG